MGYELSRVYSLEGTSGETAAGSVTSLASGDGTAGGFSDCGEREAVFAVRRFRR